MFPPFLSFPCSPPPWGGLTQRGEIPGGKTRSHLLLDTALFRTLLQSQLLAQSHVNEPRGPVKARFLSRPHSRLRPTSVALEDSQQKSKVPMLLFLTHSSLKKTPVLSRPQLLLCPSERNPHIGRKLVLSVLRTVGSFWLSLEWRMKKDSTRLLDASAYSECLLHTLAHSISSLFFPVAPETGLCGCTSWIRRPRSTGVK